MTVHKKLKMGMVFLLAVIMFQCQQNVNDLTDNTDQSNIKLSRTAQAYTNALAQLNKSEGSDSFVIKSVKIDDTALKMHIEVSYGGGCQKHEFSLVWPEVITMIYPPNFGVILNHNANGDTCEAWLTETLTIDLQDDSLWLSDQEIRDMVVTVINGSNPDEKVPNE